VTSALDQAGAFQPIDAIGHAARRNHRCFVEAGRREHIWLAGPPESGQNVKLACQALLTLSVDSRDAVDATIARATAAGGGADPNPVQDHGFMFNRSVEDPDGNVWEMVWMDATAG
jgi:hypothetical protein